MHQFSSLGDNVGLGIGVVNSLDVDLLEQQSVPGLISWGTNKRTTGVSNS